MSLLTCFKLSIADCGATVTAEDVSGRFEDPDRSGERRRLLGLAEPRVSVKEDLELVSVVSDGHVSQ